MLMINSRCEVGLTGIVGPQVRSVGAKVQSILCSELVMVGDGRRRRQWIVHHRAYGRRVDVATTPVDAADWP
ncbi:putative pectin methyltransferase QUA2 [Trichinella pseudospiralis]